MEVSLESHLEENMREDKDIFLYKVYFARLITSHYTDMMHKWALEVT